MYVLFNVSMEIAYIIIIWYYWFIINYLLVIYQVIINNLWLVMIYEPCQYDYTSEHHGW